jgi:hypothetical protein
MMAALGKALKTLQAIQRLCAFGYGEDAALLLRANINLLININYIATDDVPDERACDFAAFSHQETMKWVSAAAESSGRQAEDREPPFPPEELKMRAKRWTDVGIRGRAKRTHPVQYEVAYRFYSSFEHSDFFGLGTYIEDEDENSIQIHSHPRDEYVALVLRHTFAVTSNILECIWRYFRADFATAEERIRLASQKVYGPPPPST